MTEPEHPKDNDQIEDTVQSLVDIHEAHASDIGVVQRIANRALNVLGRPLAVVLTMALIALWVVGSIVAASMRHLSLDHIPLSEIGSVASICGLVVTLLILTTQRHEQEAERRRDQLTLHMAVLSERKIAKVIGLLEEQRRDNPLQAARTDAEADAMARPADPGVSLDQIERSSLSG